MMDKILLAYTAEWFNFDEIKYEWMRGKHVVATWQPCHHLSEDRKTKNFVSRWPVAGPS
jgi:hypothetical protein